MAQRKLDLNNLPSNNIEGDESIDERVIERVTTGKITKSKRRVTSQFATDVHGIAQNLYHEVILPAIKSGITDFVTRGIEMLIWPDGGGGGRSYSRGRSSRRTNYRNMYDSGSSRRSSGRSSRRSRQRRHTLEDIFFENRPDAENTLGQLIELIAKYEHATVGDLYSLCGLTTSHTDERYGWDSLSRVRIKNTPDGYLIDLPDPDYLEG